MSVSIIAWLAYDINRGGGKHNVKTWAPVKKWIPRRNTLIKTANKIINKQGKSVMLDFLYKLLCFMPVNGGDK